MMQEETGRKRSRGKWSLSLRLFVLAGIVGPLLFVLVFTIDGLLTPDYSPLSQSVSSLGADGPNAWIQDSNFVVFGLLLIVFAVGFWKIMQEVLSREKLRGSTLLLVLTGVGLVNDGIFTQGSVTTLHGMLHNLGFLVIFASLIGALLLIGRPLSKIPAWRGYGWYSTITGFLTLALLVISAPLADPLQLAGLFQRIVAVEAFGWYVVMGSRLFAVGRAQNAKH
jgi:hypothetical membrane protein